MPMISIIVTAFNTAEHFREVLDGIIGQTFKDIEIIVVHGGMTDGISQIISEYTVRNTEIRIISSSLKGAVSRASAANAGLNRTTGQYIGFADCNGLYDPTMYEKLWQNAERAQADLAICRYTFLDEADDKEIEPPEAGCWSPYPQITSVDLDLASRKNVLRFTPLRCRTLFRRDLIERISSSSTVSDFLCEDSLLHWNSVLNAERLLFLPEKLFKQRMTFPEQNDFVTEERVKCIVDQHDIIRDQLHNHSNYVDYKGELLRWLSVQISRVGSIEADVDRLLYHRLVPIVDQYDFEDIEKLSYKNSNRRTVAMLKNLKEKNYQDFEDSVDGQTKYEPQQAATNAHQRTRRITDSIFARGLHHLRESGPRSTLSMTTRYLKEKTGWKKLFKTKLQRQEKEVIDHSDLMAAMVILQREIRQLRAEVKELKRSR